MKVICRQHGFSLIELLLAIFILGIGIISIATLFPAGIAQQQKSTGDTIGSIVARNAMTLIRSRVDQEDFGGAEDFDERWSPELCAFTLTDIENINPWPTICGDWMWRRPTIIKDDFGEDDDAFAVSQRGAIDLFAINDSGGFGQGDPGQLVELWSGADDLPGLPYNRLRYPDRVEDGGDPSDPNDYYKAPPVKRIFAGERQHPMWYGATADRPEAQYYWDCMFRRYDGRILVAVFVYRVVDASKAGPYLIDTSGLEAPDLPRRVNLSSESSTGSWSAFQGGEILVGSELDDPMLATNQWQYPGQWIVDQNGNVHNVQRGRRRTSDDEPVRLTARPAELPVFESIESLGNPGVNVNWWDQTVTQTYPIGFIDGGVVTDIWFIPTSDSKGRLLIPVYATVQEL